MFGLKKTKSSTIEAQNQPQEMMPSFETLNRSTVEKPEDMDVSNNQIDIEVKQSQRNRSFNSRSSIPQEKSQRQSEMMSRAPSLAKMESTHNQNFDKKSIQNNESEIVQVKPDNRMVATTDIKKMRRIQKRQQNRQTTENQQLQNRSQQYYHEPSEAFSHQEKRAKLPQALKRTLQQKARNNKNYRIRRSGDPSVSMKQSMNNSRRQKRQEENSIAPPMQKSRFGNMITTAFKKPEKSCEICLGVIKNDKDSVMLCQGSTECSHTYCKDCSLEYVTYKIKMFEEVVCPQQDCDVVISQETNFYKTLPEDMRKQYEKIHAFYLTSNDPTLKLCPKSDCDGIIKIVEGEKRICDLCKRIFCPKCYFEEHEGQCDKNEIDFLQNNLHFRQCKKCGIVVERTQGCNHMTCRCKYEFCYMCGQKWGGYDHICPQNIRNGGRATNMMNDPECCCACCLQCNCIQQTCGECVTSILLIPVKVVLTFVVCVVATVIMVPSIIQICFMVVVALLLGMTGYTCELICDVCDDNCLVGLAMFVFLPITMCFGVAKAFEDIVCDEIGDVMEDPCNTFTEGLGSVWCD